MLMLCFLSLLIALLNTSRVQGESPLSPPTRDTPGNTSSKKSGVSYWFLAALLLGVTLIGIVVYYARRKFRHFRANRETKRRINIAIGSHIYKEDLPQPPEVLPRYSMKSSQVTLAPPIVDAITSVAMRRPLHDSNGESVLVVVRNSLDSDVTVAPPCYRA
ncbi:hypothetical protein K493DRAFT_295387 [Basidiobolus meristosporus CBS 931.73]|uniref:Uncharacterized protein n=1 Tax=Basidiobolus meristosporus CBS 931.73 TaxID=1314790 RepID=A0A1Y1ZD65_9FUNG|nr:hypothetical protein K493DRAFT_295387 [Basidiobolus meristosporus CBS 931.73]|eukprot:ORY07755.1 hypothetical protein K493DRAFT_295387 [Basidiobolus meristosporus CBS 931.73]